MVVLANTKEIFLDNGRQFFEIFLIADWVQSVLTPLDTKEKYRVTTHRKMLK